MQTFEFRPAPRNLDALPLTALTAVAVEPEPTETTTGYALIKQGPAVPPEEVESPTAVAAEVMVLWGANVLHVARLSPPRPFAVGERNTAGLSCEYHVPREVLGTDQLPLLLGDAALPRLVIPAGATGTLDIPGRATLKL